MRVIRTKNTEENLCNSCPRYKPEFPECSPPDVEFGNGTGNDNIIACSQCFSPIKGQRYYGEISKYDYEMKLKE